MHDNASRYCMSEVLLEMLAVIRKVALQTLPGPDIRLAGSHADGTALRCVSDIDVWVSTSRNISCQERNTFDKKLRQQKGFNKKLRLQKRSMGRKANKLEFWNGKEFVARVDVVLVNRSKDVGFCDHDFPCLTKTSSRAEARQAALEVLRERPEARQAVRMMKACCCSLVEPSSTISGFLLTHLARRILQEHDDLTALALFLQLQQLIYRAFKFLGASKRDWDPGYIDGQEPESLQDRILLDLFADCASSSSRSGLRRMRNTIVEAGRSLHHALRAIEKADAEFLLQHPVPNLLTSACFSKC